MDELKEIIEAFKKSNTFSSEGNDLLNKSMKKFRDSSTMQNVDQKMKEIKKLSEDIAEKNKELLDKLIETFTKNE
ncbi:MAG TPA: hypothetical protein PLY93_07980 [Turneriella sp.]|nr:hypothetical protein [Turneriella sp.]